MRKYLPYVRGDRVYVMDNPEDSSSGQFALIDEVGREIDNDDYSLYLLKTRSHQAWYDHDKLLFISQRNLKNLNMLDKARLKMEDEDDECDI